MTLNFLSFLDANPSRGDTFQRGGEEAESGGDPSEHQGVHHHHPTRHARPTRPTSHMFNPRSRGEETVATRVRKVHIIYPFFEMENSSA